MPVFTRLEGEKNLFKDEHGNLYSVLNGEMKPLDGDDEFEMDFLSEKFKEGDKKVESGEISCNLDNPEDCENCGS